MKGEDAVKMAQQLAVKEGLLVCYTNKFTALFENKRTEMKTWILMRLLANVKTGPITLQLLLNSSNFTGGDIIRSQHSCSHRTRQEAGKQREADCGMSYPDIAMHCGFRILDWPVHCGFRLFIRARGSDTYRRRCSRIWGRKLKLCSQCRWTKLQLCRMHRE